MTVFNLPDLGEGLPDAEIVAWHVAAGDHVVADQPLVSVETAKAVVEIPSPQRGHIAALRAKVGERVPVGAPLVEFEEGAHPDRGALVGEIAPPATATPVVRAAPAVRARAQAKGIDLAKLRGTGPGGAITIADVEGAVAPAGAEPLSGVRRAMAMAMAQSGAEIVPATVTDDADISAWPTRTDITARLVRAIVVACAASPALNAWYDSRAVARRLHGQVDLGLAVDTADGLFVPVLHNAGALTTAELRPAIERLRAQVKDRSIALADLHGATITLSNFGMFGGRHAVLTIMPPQVAILGAGRAAPRVIAVDGSIAVRRMLPLSLTFDHRVVSGGEAARFLAAAISELQRAEPS